MTIPGIHETPSAHDFATTCDRLLAAIAQSGLTLFCRIDHQAGAHAAGLTMPPATLLIYGHAKGGTPIMLASPLAALDLPLRVLIREREDGRTAIAFHPIADTLRAAGVPEPLAFRLNPAQQILVEAVAS